MENIENILRRLEEKIDFVYLQAQKARRTRQITLLLTIVFFLLPFIILIFMLPKILGGMTADIEQFL